MMHPRRALLLLVLHSLLTVPVTCPPRALINSVASSRLIVGSVPVMTNVLPASLPPALGVSAAEAV